MNDSSTCYSPTNILVEAEAFDDLGGWLIDSQFEIQMGSPYLLAHGLGKPVADAQTTVEITEANTYTVWVRSKDWVPSHHPGRFSLLINDENIGGELGANDQDWSWAEVGQIRLEAGPTTLTLSDLTGFEGRCDAIFLTANGSVPVEGAGEDARAWRKALLGLPKEPVDAGSFDVVVVGGGISGCAAALTAARLGSTVALIQDRPVLGGNASQEIGLTPRGETNDLVRELAERSSDGDISAEAVLRAEPNVTIFLEHRVFATDTINGKIISVDARETRTGAERRVRARTFIDASGMAILGILSGAETLAGQESQAEFGEPTAPEVGDDMHHGNTLFFRTRMAETPIEFPAVPWALEVAKDYANLSGQLTQPGVENGPGPIPGTDPSADPVFDFSDMDPGENPLMRFPATHFWEYGQWMDLYEDGEEIRDHLLRALIGTFANVKELDPHHYANLDFDWVAHVAAQGEYKRYRGDYVLTETDIRDHKMFSDAVVNNNGAFCLHYPFEPGEGEYDFRLKNWTYDLRDHQPYAIPFRSLHSTNIDNLMMAGKHISVTHIAGSSIKLMGNGAQHGVATGAAAYLCAKHDTTPRNIGREYIAELQSITHRFTGAGYGPAATTNNNHALVDERPSTAREAAERHAQDVVDGNMARAMGDFYGNSLNDFLGTGVALPNPTTGWEILSETSLAGSTAFHVRYSNDQTTTELKTTWHHLAGEWRLTKAIPA